MLHYSPARRILPKDAIVHEFHISTYNENPQDISKFMGPEDDTRETDESHPEEYAYNVKNSY